MSIHCLLSHDADYDGAPAIGAVGAGRSSRQQWQPLRIAEDYLRLGSRSQRAAMTCRMTRCKSHMISCDQMPA